MIANSEKSRLPQIAAVSFLFFGLAGLALNEITRIDVRFALMVQDAARYGVGVFPTINGVPYPDYPSAMVILSYVTTLGGKIVTLPLLALPTLIFGALTLFYTWKLGEKQKTGLGVYALFALCCSWEFINQLFVGIGMDVPEMFAGILMLYLLVSEGKERAAGIAFPLLLVFCFVFRGPLGLLLLGGGVAGFLLFSARFRTFLRYALIGGATAALCAFLGYYAIILQGGESLWHDVLDWQILSRMSGANEPFYFFTDAMVSFAPVTILGIASLLWKPRRIWSSPVFRGVFGFVFIILLMLSVPACKHLRYMSIAIPAFALLAGEFIVSFDGKRRQKITAVIVPVAVAGIGVAGIALLISGLIVFGKNAPFIHTALFFACTATLAFYLHRFADEKRRVSLLAMSLLCFYYLMLFPFTVRFEHSRDFVAAAEKFRGERPLLIYQIGPDHLDNYYILHLASHQCNDVKRIYCEEPAAPTSLLGKMYPFISPDDAEKMFFRSSGGGFVLLEEKREKELLDFVEGHKLSCKTLLHGRLGRRKCLVVEIKAPPYGE